jgi:aldehyde:ferredoxin oxidoreductase
MSGYMGKILRVNLTTGQLSTIDTARYAEYGGGNGIGTAICWDLIEDWTIDGFDPKNVIAIMTSPLSGTLAPSVSGRTEIVGIGVQAYPIGWFTRSNFGGRFAGQLKYAGWDGIVLEGASDRPVWIDIRNDEVQIRDAGGLWGLDTYETQKDIWRQVGGGASLQSWWQTGSGRDSGRTTQKPAVLAIGPVGESQSRMGCLIHDAGNGAGQGGFGGIWGAKNLKAISVIGTGSVEVADPNALLEARIWAKGYGCNVDAPVSAMGNYPFSGTPGYANSYPEGMPSRPQGCMGCHKSCRGRTASGHGNESQCLEFLYYGPYDSSAHGGTTDASLVAADLVNKYGINDYAMHAGIRWLLKLNEKGIAGPGLEIDTDLPFDKIGTAEFVQTLFEQIATREGIGADLADGLSRAAEKWGRLEEDLATGDLGLQYWGYSHHYDARTEVEWGYGSILGERDINEHDFNFPCYWTPSIASLYGAPLPFSAEEMAELIGAALKPYSDPMMIDYSDEGIYAESMAKLVAWHRHYTRFWKQSIGYCDWAWADFLNPYGPGFKGLTPEGEPKFLNAVTGGNMSFEDGIETGRKIWNLTRAIWVLQGRHRDMEVFPEYTYTQPGLPGYTTYEVPYTMPTYVDGTWDYRSVAGRVIDRDKFEEWKTKYYALEGWDTSSGYPTRAALAGVGLDSVADKLEAAGKLGG